MCVACVQVLHASESGRTSVTIAHKLRSIEDADLILVMSNGTVVEQGTHAALLTRPNSTYSRMWGQQRHGDENFFDNVMWRPGLYDTHLELMQRTQRAEQLDEALALQAVDGGWLW